jgi:hypothetical protein
MNRQIGAALQRFTCISRPARNRHLPCQSLPRGQIRKVTGPNGLRRVAGRADSAGGISRQNRFWQGVRCGRFCSAPVWRTISARGLSGELWDQRLRNQLSRFVILSGAKNLSCIQVQPKRDSVPAGRRVRRKARLRMRECVFLRLFSHQRRRKIGAFPLRTTCTAAGRARWPNRAGRSTPASSLPQLAVAS